MVNFFEYASDDKSLQYLAQIFGYVNGVIPIPTSGTSAPQPLPSGVSITLLGTMFKTFNSVVLAVGALIVVYITVVGVMQTAHEGEFMGKKWHSLWVPLRVVLGIAAMFPTGSGYCGLQIIMMWVIVQGIGAADKMWSVSLSYISVLGSPYAQLTLPSVGAANALNNLFQGIVCDATFRETGKNPDTSPLPGGYYYCGQTNDPAFCGMRTNTFDGSDRTNTVYKMGPGGACGRLSYCSQADSCVDANSLKCAACTAQVKALDKIINSTLIPIATYFVQTDYSYRNFVFNNDPSVPDTGTTGFDTGWIANYCADKGIGAGKNKCCVPGTTGCEATDNAFTTKYPVYDEQGKSFGASATTVQDFYMTYSIIPKYSAANFVQTVTMEYMDTVSGSVTDYIIAHSKDAPLDPMLTQARNYGWIMAGGYYYFLGKHNANNLTDSLPVLDFVTGSPANPELNGSFANMRINYGAVAALKDAMRQAGTTTSGGAQKSTAVASQPGASSDVGAAATGAIGNMQSTFQASTSPNLAFNPLLQLQMAGTTILLIAQILYVIILVVTIAVGIVSGLNGFIAGNGFVNPMSTMVIILYMILLPALMGLFSVMIAVGGLLGIYVPLIPYTIFLFGAIGWMLSVVEAMVAGPLVALGILAPGGHHEVLGKAEPALMLLFNVFLRPTLMIMGLIISLMIASVVVLMINTAFWGTWMSGGVVPGPVGVGLLGGQGGNAGVIGSPLSFIIFVVAYVMVIVAAMNKCFEAIHIIPEKVMRWIGGQGEQYGESAALGEIKRGTESAGHGATKAGETGQQTALKRGEGIGQEKREAKNKTEPPSVT